MKIYQNSEQDGENILKNSRVSIENCKQSQTIEGYFDWKSRKNLKPIKLLHFRRNRLGEDVCALGRRARHVDRGGEEALDVDGETGTSM